MKKRVKAKILFTGNGALIMEDLMGHMPANYQAEKCHAIEPKFREAMKEFQPHVVVVCLAKETRTMLHMYSVLEENKDYHKVPIIAIGNEDDCDIFKRNIFQKNMSILARPIDTQHFLDTLQQYVDLILESEAYTEEDDKATTAEAERIAEEKERKAAEAAEKELLDKIEIMTQIQGRKMILVVDDDVRMLNVIKLYLQELYDITVVPSGKLALKYLSKKSADLVLLDYMMPDEDGPAILQQIRENSPDPDIPVVFLTGVSDKDKVMKGLEFRPDGYILKPVKREVLIERVTEILLGLH